VKSRFPSYPWSHFLQAEGAHGLVQELRLEALSRTLEAEDMDAVHPFSPPIEVPLEPLPAQRRERQSIITTRSPFRFPVPSPFPRRPLNARAARQVTLEDKVALLDTVVALVLETHTLRGFIADKEAERTALLAQKRSPSPPPCPPPPPSGHRTLCLSYCAQW
jgi:hypothetical protein